MHALATRILCTTLSVLTGACATVRSDSIARDEQVFIVAKAGRPVGDGNVAIELSNRAMAKDAGSGFAGGAGLGSLTGLACGPAFLLCVPVFALAFGGVGAAAGAAVGAIRSLPQESRDQLRGRIEAHVRDHNVREELLAGIIAPAKAQWDVIPSGAPTLVIVQVDDVSLRMLPEDRIGVWVQVSVTVHRMVNGTQVGTPPREISYLGPLSHVGLWIDDRNGFIADNFDQAFRQVGRNVVSELAR
jgi:hypothetical protein